MNHLPSYFNSTLVLSVMTCLCTRCLCWMASLHVWASHRFCLSMSYSRYVIYVLWYILYVNQDIIDSTLLLIVCLFVWLQLNLNSMYLSSIGNCCIEGGAGPAGHPYWTGETLQIQPPPSTGSESCWTVREVACWTGYRELWVHPGQCNDGKTWYYIFFRDSDCWRMDWYQRTDINLNWSTLHCLSMGISRTELLLFHFS